MSGIGAANALPDVAELIASRQTRRWHNGADSVIRSGPYDRPANRRFCILDNGSDEQLEGRGFDRPQIAVINGMVMKNAALFSDADYKKHVRDLGDRYLSTYPRPIHESD